MSSQDNILYVPDVSFNIASATIIKNESESNEKEKFSPFLHPRIPFLRKIYSLLFVTIFCILLIAGALAYLIETEFFKNYIVLFSSLMIFCVISILAYWKKHFFANQPRGIFLYFVFYTIFFFFLTSLLSLDQSKLAFMIFVEVDSVFLFLSLYSFITQNLLTYQVATLFILTPIFLVFNIFLIFSELSLEILIFASMTGILWGFYLIYETQTIMKEVRHIFTIEKSDIFVESITIYCDLFLLFLRNSELLVDILITNTNSSSKKAISEIN